MKPLGVIGSFSNNFNSICDKHSELSCLVSDLTQNSFTICPKYFSCSWKLKLFVASHKFLLVVLQQQVPFLVWLCTPVMQLLPFPLPNYNGLFYFNPLHADMSLNHIFSHKNQRSNANVGGMKHLSK